MKKWLFLIAALPLIFFSCRKDVNEITVTGTEYQPPVVVVTGHLTGFVVDESANPMPNAIVRVDNKATTTDGNGFFQFRDLEMNSRGTYVTVSRTGYFPGSTRFFPLNGSSNFVKVEMLPLAIRGSFPGGEGGSVSFNGAKVSLPANGVVDAMNNTYEGDVQVAAHWLNPTDPNLNDIMPGNLQGVNDEGREVSMATFGMLAVELMDAAGNELQVAPGRKAELTFPVPAELQGNAPAEIPLWYFDEEAGLWVQEGTAELIDGNYVGKVAHFSFWNCDWPYPLVQLSGTVVDQAGAPVANAQVQLYLTNFSSVGYAWTNSDGEFSGLVPADEPMELRIHGLCDFLLVEAIGPFSEDSDAGTFTVVNPEASSISGNLVDCDNNPVEGGIVRLDYPEGSTFLLSGTDGAFSTSVLLCDAAEVTIQAFDLDAGLQTDPAAYTVDATIDLGEISVCDEVITEYINADVDGSVAIFLAPNLAIDTIEFSPDSINFMTYSSINGMTITMDDVEHSINMYVSELSVGSYTGDDLAMSYYFRDNSTPVGGPLTYLDCWLPCNDMTVTITANGGPGGFLEGTFSGTMDGWGGNQQQLMDVPVSGDFRVEIPQ